MKCSWTRIFWSPLMELDLGWSSDAAFAGQQGCPVILIQLERELPHSTTTSILSGSWRGWGTWPPPSTTNTYLYLLVPLVPRVPLITGLLIQLEREYGTLKTPTIITNPFINKLTISSLFTTTQTFALTYIYVRGIPMVFWLMPNPRERWSNKKTWFQKRLSRQFPFSRQNGNCLFIQCRVRHQFGRPAG